jgi:hypothetical protein
LFLDQVRSHRAGLRQGVEYGGGPNLRLGTDFLEQRGDGETPGRGGLEAIAGLFARRLDRGGERLSAEGAVSELWFTILLLRNSVYNTEPNDIFLM